MSQFRSASSLATYPSNSNLINSVNSIRLTNYRAKRQRLSLLLIMVFGVPAFCYFSTRSVLMASSLAQIAVSDRPVAMAFSAVTDRINTNYYSVNMTDIYGMNNSTVTAATNTKPQAVAINSVLSETFVTNNDSSNVTIINSANNSMTAAIANDSNPSSADGVNALTNSVYLNNLNSNNMPVMVTPDSADLSVTLKEKSGAPARNKDYKANFIIINNSQTDKASNVKLKFVFISGPHGGINLKEFTLSKSTGSCTPKNVTPGSPVPQLEADCTLGDLQPQEKVTVTTAIGDFGPSGYVYDFKLTVSSDTSDPNPNNNTVEDKGGINASQDSLHYIHYGRVTDVTGKAIKGVSISVLLSCPQKYVIRTTDFEGYYYAGYPDDIATPLSYCSGQCTFVTTYNAIPLSNDYLFNPASTNFYVTYDMVSTSVLDLFFSLPNFTAYKLGGNK